MRGAHCRTNSLRGSGSLEGERTCAWAAPIARSDMKAATQRRMSMMAFAG
jgi:hypothetical protein